MYIINAMVENAVPHLLSTEDRPAALLGICIVDNGTCWATVEVIEEADASVLAVGVSVPAVDGKTAAATWSRKETVAPIVRNICLVIFNGINKK